MRIIRLPAILGLLGFLLAITTAKAEVAVTFIDPGHYTNAALYGGYGAAANEPALEQIRTELQLLGMRYLKPGQSLAIEVLNVDLAGRFEPWRRPGYNDVRFMRDIYPPKIRLSYTLTEAGRPPRHAAETISDIDYLVRPLLQHTGAVMPYEKAMLDDWFRKQFGGGPS